MTRQLTWVALSLALSGCWRTTIRSGLPPGEEAKDYDERVHQALVLGTLETRKPHALADLCPMGWSEIHVRKGFLNGLLTVITLGIYSPQTVTVVCSTGEDYPATPPKLSIDP